MDDNSYLHLTDAGRAIAERTYERHELLTATLSPLAVQRAYRRRGRPAARTCHQQETFSKLKEHAEKMMALQAKREQEQAKEQQ